MRTLAPEEMSELCSSKNSAVVNKGKSRLLPKWCVELSFFGKAGGLLRNIRPLVYDQHHMTEKKEALYSTWGHLLDSALNISSSVSLHPSVPPPYSLQDTLPATWLSQSCSHMLREDLCVSTSESSGCDSDLALSAAFFFPKHIDFPRVQTEHISLWLGFQSSSKTMENNWEEKPSRYLLIRTYAQQTQLCTGIYRERPSNSNNHLNELRTRVQLLVRMTSAWWSVDDLLLLEWKSKKRRLFMCSCAHCMCKLHPLEDKSDADHPVNYKAFLPSGLGSWHVINHSPPSLVSIGVIMALLCFCFRPTFCCCLTFCSLPSPFFSVKIYNCSDTENVHNVFLPTANLKFVHH